MICGGRVRIAQHCCLAILLSVLSLAGHAQTAADTTRLAAASDYLETGGLNIGMSLGDFESAVRTLNPLMQLTNTEEVTVWPPDRADTSKAAPPDSPVSVFGQATETQVLSDSANLKMQQLFWYFDKDGKLMPPVAPYSRPPCGEGMTQCQDRSMFTLNITASGSGMVTAMNYQVGNGPLFISAEQATDA